MPEKTTKAHTAAMFYYNSAVHSFSDDIYECFVTYGIDMLVLAVDIPETKAGKQHVHDVNIRGYEALININ